MQADDLCLLGIPQLLTEWLSEIFGLECVIELKWLRIV